MFFQSSHLDCASQNKEEVNWKPSGTPCHGAKEKSVESPRSCYMKKHFLWALFQMDVPNLSSRCAAEWSESVLQKTGFGKHFQNNQGALQSEWGARQVCAAGSLQEVLQPASNNKVLTGVDVICHTVFRWAATRPHNTTTQHNTSSSTTMRGQRLHAGTPASSLSRHVPAAFRLSVSSLSFRNEAAPCTRKTCAVLLGVRPSGSS